MATIKIGIIGAGPAGLTLALLLHEQGIHAEIFEAKDESYVISRVRAGLLESNTVQVFDKLHVSERLHTEGIKHEGCIMSYNGEPFRIDFKKHTDTNVTIYGQQEVVKDLIAACKARNIPLHFNNAIVSISDLNTTQPKLEIGTEDQKQTKSYDYIAACDGYHGVGRQFLPRNSYSDFTMAYPFSWLGILAHASPSYEELIYAYHENGFALASLRSNKISRLYLQVQNEESLHQWPDEVIWHELETRLGITLDKGQVFEKGITPMRSYVINNMQYGRLFLAGDAAHIVPPTGAKGLNLAVADVWVLAKALSAVVHRHDSTLLDNYSKICLRRVWRVQDFSNFMTTLCHKCHDPASFEAQMQKAKFEYIKLSESYQKTIAENYVGLPYEVFN